VDHTRALKGLSHLRRPVNVLVCVDVIFLSVSTFPLFLVQIDLLKIDVSACFQRWFAARAFLHIVQFRSLLFLGYILLLLRMVCYVVSRLATRRWQRVDFQNFFQNCAAKRGAAYMVRIGGDLSGLHPSYDGFQLLLTLLANCF